MLRLCEHVGGDPRGICAVIGDDQDFAWAREEIDSDSAKDLTLCFDNENITGTENLEHGLDRGSAISDGSDSLRATGLVNLRRTGKLQRIKQRDIYVSVFVRGCGDDDLRHASGGGECACHDCSRDEWSRPARHVNADSLE